MDKRVHAGPSDILVPCQITGCAEFGARIASFLSTEKIIVAGRIQAKGDVGNPANIPASVEIAAVSYEFDRFGSRAKWMRFQKQRNVSDNEPFKSLRKLSCRSHMLSFPSMALGR
ncbi:hypothetical protein DYI23_21345 [Roseibium polysiphoniae]|uniref:Uncharacterized protein n=1 Tax=Roseibium polysiphoniae TaxID=2571221 RepID=A0A944CH27_9HYPH|nr:hypothetical protein [Roseibium polysiphoniae]